MPKLPSGTPWAPFLPCPASKTELDQKKCEKRAPRWRLFGALLALCAPSGSSYAGPSGQKEHPEGIQGKFCTHLKNIKIPRVFDGFWRSGLPSGAQNGGLEGLRGATWGSLGGSWETFWDLFCIRILRMIFGVPKGAPDAVQGKGRRQGRGSAEGGEA